MTILGLGSIFAWSGVVGVNGIAITNYYGIPISANQFSWITSSGSLGAASMFLTNQHLAKKIGRKKTILWTSVFYVTGWLLFLFPISAWSFVIGKYFHGLSYGIYAYVVPLYITEIGENSIRGRLSSLHEFSYSLGYVYCYALGLLVSLPTISILCCSIIVVHVVVFSFMPESPVYWLQQNNEEAARVSLTRLRGGNNNNYDIDKELQELREFVDTRRGNVSFFTALSSSKVAKRAMLISCGIMGLQQLSGIGVVLSYSFSILNNNYDNTIMSLLIITFFRLISSCTNSFFIDSFGRRITLLMSIVPLVVTCFVLAVYEQLPMLGVNVNDEQWVPTVAVAIYVAAFSFGFSSFPQFVSTEFLPASIKDIGFSFSTAMGHLFAFFIINIYGHLNDNIYLAFYLFGVINLITIVFVLKLLPETQKRTLAKIQKELYSNEEMT